MSLVQNSSTAEEMKILTGGVNVPQRPYGPAVEHGFSHGSTW